MGAWVGAALTGLGALSGLFGSKKTTTDQTYNSSSSPNYDPQNLDFRNFLINQWKNLAGGGGSGEFQQAYTTGGLRNINKTSGIASQAIQDMLTSRGLGRTSAGVGTIGDVSLSNASKTADFLNSVPLTMDQRMQQILGGASGYQASLPVGTNTSGSSHTVGTGSAPTSPVAGLFSGGSQGLATYLGQLSAQSNFEKILRSYGGGGGYGGGSDPGGNP